MAYTKSLARKDFCAQLTYMLENSRQAGFKKHGLPKACVDMIYQAAIFKACAYLEEYIKSLVTDWLHRIKSTPLTCEILPRELIFYIIMKSQQPAFESHFRSPSEVAVFTALSKIKQFELLTGSKPIPTYITNNSMILDGKKYPSKRNLEALFSRLGIKIFTEAQIRKRRDISLSLQSFLDVREALAHQDPPDVTYKDVKNHFEQLFDLVDAIDRVFFKFVCSHGGLVCWKNA